MKVNRKCGAVLGSILLACVALPADAAASFEFDISLTGLGTYTGSFSVDAFQGTGDEAFNPDGNDGGTLLSFAITVAGIDFDMTDDDDYPEFPKVAFTDGVLTLINFVTDTVPQMGIDYLAEQRNSAFFSSSAARFEGILTAIRQVPEPATLALFGLGLAGIPLVRRRRTPL